jgi:hypothetical protein
MSTTHGSLRAVGDRAFGLIAAVVCAFGVAASPTAAATAFGLTTANQIVAFDTSAPGTPIGTVTISGLQPGEIALGLDLRPATGQLYILASTSRLYVVNPTTGLARAVDGPFTPALSGTAFGFDFNPTVDRIRVVSDTGQNFRLNPDTGAVAAVDTSLNPGAPRLVGSAYSNNFAGATVTTLYGIDSTTDQLVLQNPPNNGTLVAVGPLGVDTSDLVGFDISANEGFAYASLTSVGNVTSFHRIDLTTGAATLVGTFAGGPYVDLTVLSRGVPMVALRRNVAGEQLIRFHSASPGTIQSAVTVTGLQPGEGLVGIDVRPADGRLYGVGTTSRLYLLDPFTGAATAIGAPFADPLQGLAFGVEFDPTADQLRIVSDAEANLRINPATGAVAAIDTPLNPAGTVVEAAYLNNIDGATTTTLYDIDATSDVLLVQNPANSGTLTPVGSLGFSFNVSGTVGFDISPLDNTAFAALRNAGNAALSFLAVVNLRTGAATVIDVIGDGSFVYGLAAMPLVYQFAEGSTGTFFDTDLLLANPTETPVPATITYFTEAGRVVTQTVQLAGLSRTTVSADANAQLGATAFSTTVDSPLGVAIAVERTMRWDATGYGMHTEKAASAPARTWYFAEGAQGFYQTFFLFTNPTPAPNSVSVQFLLENGTTVTRTYPMAASSRLTIYAGSIPELVNQAFGTVATFTVAGAAERAMYFGTPVFNGGHESAGVTRTHRNWFFAEGATGSFFTTFILLSNPNATPANVTMTYFRERGGVVTRTRTIPAATRLTVNIALEDLGLSTGTTATGVTSDVGIVVERAMYWPFDPSQWQEAHNAFGVTGMVRQSALAEGRVGGPFNFQTFLLLANTDNNGPATVLVTFLREAGVAFQRFFVVPATSRLTITTGPGSMVPELANEAFGIRLSTSSEDRPVIAERALYSDANGITWAAGSAASATPLPTPLP